MCPMTACMEDFPPPLRVTCALYSPLMVPVTRVVALKPSTCVPPPIVDVGVQVRLLRPGMSTAPTTVYPCQVGVLPNSADENVQPSGVFADPSTKLKL